MKTLQTICLSLIIATGATSLPGGEVRKDVNPAMHYYQAFLLTPDLSQVDRDYLFARQWRGQKLPPRVGELLRRYDNQFNLVRQAARTGVPCDWGIDMSPGPATLLPHLARCRGIAQTMRLRVMWQLQEDHQADAREDIVAVLGLGRNSSQDGTLVSALVQIALENFATSVVAENYHRFSSDTLKSIWEGFASAPARGMMVTSMSVEKKLFLDWLVMKVVALQKENPGDDTKVMAAVHQIIAGFEGGQEGPPNPPKASLWERVNAAAHGTSEGVLQLLREEEGLYRDLAEMMSLPPSDFDARAKAFNTEVERSANPFISETLPAVQKARPKEFAIQATLSMVHAAVEYKLHGESGLRSVTDPFGSGPFSFERFAFEGVDRGFILSSAYAGRGFREAMIFVEKEGAPFSVTGPTAGKAESK